MISISIVVGLLRKLLPGHLRPNVSGRRLILKLGVDEAAHRHRLCHQLFAHLLVQVLLQLGELLSAAQVEPLKVAKSPRLQALAEDEVPLDAGRRVPLSLVGGQVEAVLGGVVLRRWWW